jgi:hypothetical protein
LEGGGEGFGGFAIGGSVGEGGAADFGSVGQFFGDRIPRGKGIVDHRIKVHKPTFSS